MFDTNQQFDNECPDCREWEQEVERLKNELSCRLEPSQERLLKRCLSKACGTTVEEIECRPIGATNDRCKEVERLKRAYKILRQATFQGHATHFDPTHGSGSGCPACLEIIRLRLEADNILEPEGGEVGDEKI